MKTLTISTQESSNLLMHIYSGSADFAASDDVTEIKVEFGYFAFGNEVSVGEDMTPIFSIENNNVVLRQTKEQFKKASDANITLKLFGNVPKSFSMECLVEHGTVKINGVQSCKLKMNSGTSNILNCKKSVEISADSGTISVAGLKISSHHKFNLQNGNLTVYAGNLLAFLEAEVSQGIIQGDLLGNLTRIGHTGWRLDAIENDPKTSIKCRVGSGTIILHNKQES